MPPPQSLLVRREEDGHGQERRRRRTRIAKEPHCNSLTSFKIRPIAIFHSCRCHELYPLENGVDGSPSLQSRFRIFGGRGRRPHRGQALPRVICHLFPCQFDCDLAVLPEIIYFCSFSVWFSFLFKHLTTTLPSSTSSAVAVSTSFPRFNSSGV